MKRWGGILVATLALAAICLLAVGTQPAQAGETYKLKIANWYAPAHPVNIALKEKFLPAIKEGTGGKVEGFIYDSSQLGGEREFTEGVRIGTIEMATLSSGAVPGFFAPVMVGDAVHTRSFISDRYAKPDVRPVGALVVTTEAAHNGRFSLKWDFSKAAGKGGLYDRNGAKQRYSCNGFLRTAVCQYELAAVEPRRNQFRFITQLRYTFILCPENVQ